MINISKTVLAEALYEEAPDVYTTREAALAAAEKIVAALAAAEKIVAAVRERESRMLIADWDGRLHG